ncbi:hypothetical protein SAMN04487947_1218 [Halogeometricum rufum]|uniref:Uncharacterized protein n=1 Tax=Halogeometricum rufum TaxID=553469 RepID=A0A1I6GIQ2_9EURY|nr:hypothetical protein [Halogeometricum rufum]SFR42058.1 hypothetical protein SAMN04487947_1218 [Halogeometricum rufum]
MTPTPSYSDRSYSTGHYGAPATGYAGFDAPWHINGIRVDGLSAENPLSPVVPGRSVTYRCVCAAQPSNGDPDDDPRARFDDLREYLVRSRDVITYDPPGQDVFYREQFDDSFSQLVRIEPLAKSSDGTYTDGNPPPTREGSMYDGRWAVVTGGQSNQSLASPRTM